VPLAPDLVVDTARQAQAESLAALLAFVEIRVPRA